MDGSSARGWSFSFFLRPLGLTAALGLLLVVSFVLLKDKPQPAENPAELATSFYWESPTDLYLEAPGPAAVAAVLNETSATGPTRSQR